jgi:hypothetical protein
MFQGIAQARELARSIEDGRIGCSATAKPSGKGRDAQVHVKKTRRLWQDEVERPHAHMLCELLLRLAPGTPCSYLGQHEI